MWDARVLRNSSGNSTYEMVDLRCCRLWVETLILILHKMLMLTGMVEAEVGAALFV
jgi:hypothetical protein